MAKLPLLSQTEFSQLPHVTFYDSGPFLIHEIRSSAREAAEGWDRDVKDLCGHQFQVFPSGPIRKTQVIKLMRHGLPIGNPHNLDWRGILYLMVTITGPEKNIVASAPKQIGDQSRRGVDFHARLCGTNDRFESRRPNPDGASLMAEAPEYFQERAQSPTTEN